MKILIVSKAFYPTISPRSFRATELVKEFLRKGHEVTLLTVKDDSIHESFEEKYGVKIKDFGPLNFPEIDITSGNKAYRLVKRIARRALLQLFEYPKIELVSKVKKALSNEKGYDLLISIAVPHPIHWGVAAAWRRKSKIADTWVADCGDPYMRQNLDSFNKLFYFKYFEKDFCRKADYISVPIEEAKEGYYPEFKNKIIVIPQGFNFNEIDEDITYKKNEVPTFAYAGSLIPGGRDPRKFLEYLISQNKPYKFIVFTKTPELIRPYITKSKGRVEIRNTIPRPDLLKELSKMDFLVNFENESPLMMPSKLIDYYLTGRPVLSVASTEIEESVIDQFLKGDYQSAQKFKEMEKYRIENVCKQFLQLTERHEYAGAIE